MKFYRLEPDTSGGLGDDTVHEGWEDRPMRISKLQIELDFWPSDDFLVADMYGYVGTHRLAEAIKKNGLTGVEFDYVDVIEGDQFWLERDEHPGQELPELLWFKFTGQAGVDDFGLIQGPCTLPLVVSERALVLLRSFEISGAEIEDYQPEASRDGVV